MDAFKIIQPPGWKPPKGYANGVLARGQLLFVAGQIGWDGQEVFHSDDVAVQWAQALDNVLAVVTQAGAGPQHIARMTVYVTDKKEYAARRREIGAAWKERMGAHFPAMALVEVKGLLEDRAKVEIEATCVLPDPPAA